MDVAVEDRPAWTDIQRLTHKGQPWMDVALDLQRAYTRHDPDTVKVEAQSLLQLLEADTSAGDWRQTEMGALLVRLARDGI